MIMETPAQTTVVHVRDPQGYDVYIGRGKDPIRGIESKWGNPFSWRPSAFNIIPCASREDAIEKYRDYIMDTPELLESLRELKGKRLGCFCKPRNKCHGDALVELIGLFT